MFRIAPLSNTLLLKAIKLPQRPIPTRSLESQSTSNLVDPRLVHTEEMDIPEGVEA
jgi:hypothetical protein